MWSAKLVRCSLPGLGLLAALSFTRVAAADDAKEAPFGAAGQVVLDDLAGAGNRALSFMNQTQGLSLGGLFTYAKTSSSQRDPSYAMDDASENFAISPTLDVFLQPRLSLGVEGSVGWSRGVQTLSQPGRGSGFGGGALVRIGYVLPLASRLSLWTRVAGGGASASYHGGANFGGGSTWVAIGALEPSFVLRVHRLIYLSVEPDVAVVHRSDSSELQRSRFVSSATVASVGGFAGAGLVF